MEVINGTSESWGTFGDVGTLKQRVDVGLDNLNHFNPAHSIRNSRVSYGANRVKMFKRTAYRYYTADGLYRTVTSDVIVEQWAS